MAKRGPKEKEVNPELCEAMASQGLSQVQICQVLGISYETLMKRKRASKEFTEIIDRGRAKGLAKVSNSLFKSAVKGNVVAQKYYLSNRGPDEWKERKTVEQTGPDGGPIEHKVTVEFV